MLLDTEVRHLYNVKRGTQSSLTHRSGGQHHTLSLAAESLSLSVFSFRGGSRMKTLTAVFAIVILLVVTSCGDDFDTKAEKQKLEAVSKDLYDAWTNHDLEVMEKHLDEDLVMYYAISQGYKGTDSRDAWLSSSPGTTSTIHNREWLIAPDLAVATSHETWLWPDSTTDRMLITLVWEKTDDQWRLVRGHVSDVP
jgi:ketosteroid isomerase-like protein